MPSLPITIAAVLEAERLRQGLSTNALSIKAGLSAGRVHEILTGDTLNPGFLTVLAITRALGKSLGWLERQIRAGDSGRKSR